VFNHDSTIDIIKSADVLITESRGLVLRRWISSYVTCRDGGCK